MNTDIIVALVGLLGVIITVVATSRNTQNKMTNELAAQNAVQNTKIDQMGSDISALRDELNTKIDSNNALVETKLQHLTDEVRQHNNFAQRVPALDGDIKLLTEKVKVANKRIDDLESDVKELRRSSNP